MVYTAAHGKLSILGDSYSAQEQWQVGLRLIGTTPPTAGQLSTVNTAVGTFLATTALLFTAGFRYLGLKWAPQDVDGHYGEAGEAVEWWRPTPLTGSAMGAPQLALVTSLRTARARGYASNGRMYWPSAQLPDTTTGLITSAQAIAVANACGTLMTAIRGSGVGNPAVMSTFGAGRTEPVTGVRVGRVLDTQRRRRNGLPETYSAETVVPL